MLFEFPQLFSSSKVESLLTKESGFFLLVLRKIVKFLLSLSENVIILVEELDDLNNLGEIELCFVVLLSSTYYLISVTF